MPEKQEKKEVDFNEDILTLEEVDLEILKEIP
jgi:hypothetical protein